MLLRIVDLNWLPRSPDLSMCDFFLLGHFQVNTYREKLQKNWKPQKETKLY